MVIIAVWYQLFPIQLEHVASHFFISSDRMADQKPRNEYVPRQAQKDPETVTNDMVKVPEEIYPKWLGCDNVISFIVSFVNA